jgi:phosphodiesterase/alkaline phosphatase D-like protein
MMSWDHAPGFALNPDGWDGYQAERRELTSHIRAKGIDDVTVLTGDIHTFVAGDVTDDGRATGNPVATEFVGGSITSGTLDSPAGDLIAANAVTNPHWKFANFARRGYGVMDLSPRELKVRFRSPTTVKERDAPVETLAEFRVARGTPRVERTR